MNAEPILANIAKRFHDCHLEVVLVGNAAAALQGAPVTALDFDFMFRNTPRNLKNTPYEPPHALSEGAPAQRRVGIVVFILTT
jgi:hypothetical protein